MWTSYNHSAIIWFKWDDLLNRLDHWRRYEYESEYQADAREAAVRVQNLARVEPEGKTFVKTLVVQVSFDVDPNLHEFKQSAIDEIESMVMQHVRSETNSENWCNGRP